MPVDARFLIGALTVHQPVLAGESKDAELEANNRRTEAAVERNGQQLRVMKNAVRAAAGACGPFRVIPHRTVPRSLVDSADLFDLKALAAQEGVTLPDSLDAKHQKMVDKMAALTGSQFDDAYIAGMIKAHKKDSKAFKAESAETKDAGIKGFLEKSIPIVDEHLARISAMKT